MHHIDSILCILLSYLQATDSGCTIDLLYTYVYIINLWAVLEEVHEVKKSVRYNKKKMQYQLVSK